MEPLKVALDHFITEEGLQISSTKLLRVIEASLRSAIFSGNPVKIGNLGGFSLVNNRGVITPKFTCSLNFACSLNEHIRQR